MIVHKIIKVKHRELQIMEKKQIKLKNFFSDEKREEINNNEQEEYQGYLEMLAYERSLKEKAREWLGDSPSEDFYENLLFLVDKFEEEVDNNPDIATKEQARHDLFQCSFIALRELIDETPYETKLENYKKYVYDPYRRYKSYGKDGYFLISELIVELKVKFGEDEASADRSRTKWKIEFGKRKNNARL